jgi:hypothetical protein
MGLYLGDEALGFLQEQGVVKDGETGLTIKIFGRNYAVRETPQGRDPANIIGLTLLRRLNLHILTNQPSMAEFPYFDSEASLINAES